MSAISHSQHFIEWTISMSLAAIETDNVPPPGEPASAKLADVTRDMKFPHNLTSTTSSCNPSASDSTDPIASDRSTPDAMGVEERPSFLAKVRAQASAARQSERAELRAEASADRMPHREKAPSQRPKRTSGEVQFKPKQKQRRSASLPAPGVA